MSDTVGPHGSQRDTCKKCDEEHAVNEHRFHGDGAFCDTHISSSSCEVKPIKQVKPKLTPKEKEEKNTDLKTQAFLNEYNKYGDPHGLYWTMETGRMDIKDEIKIGNMLGTKQPTKVIGRHVSNETYKSKPNPKYDKTRIKIAAKKYADEVEEHYKTR